MNKQYYPLSKKGIDEKEYYNYNKTEPDAKLYVKAEPPPSRSLVYSRQELNPNVRYTSSNRAEVDTDGPRATYGLNSKISHSGLPPRAPASKHQLTGSAMIIRQNSSQRINQYSSLPKPNQVKGPQP